MQVLVMGASGATGRLLVEQLLKRDQRVKALVRSAGKLPQSWREDERVTVIESSISEMSTARMAAQLADCQGVASCLGHNLTWRGIYGKPYRLVTDAVRLACDAIRQNAPQTPVKFVLMNTSGNRNRDIDEPISLGQKLVVGLLRLVLPPHADNEDAAEYLRAQIGKESREVEWVVVRPDNLIDNEAVSPYTLYPSPIRSAIFDAGKTSRINVGNFMARLFTEKELWRKWRGHMPLIYNEDSP